MENFLIKDDRSFNLCLLTVTEILVFLGNILIILTVRKIHTDKNFDNLIAFLALLDLTSSCTVLPIAITFYAAPSIYGTKSLPEVWCKFSAIAYIFIQISSTSSITLVTLDRFVATRKPFFYRTTCENRKKNLRLGLIILTSIGLVLSLCIILLEKEPLIFRDGICSLPKRSWGKLVILILTLPQILVVSVCYCSVVQVARKFDRRRLCYFRNRYAHDFSKTLTQQQQQPKSRQCASHGEPLDDITKRRIPNQRTAEEKHIFMRNSDVNRGTRLSVTVALIIGVYYIPWIMELVSITDLLLFIIIA